MKATKTPPAEAGQIAPPRVLYGDARSERDRRSAKSPDAAASDEIKPLNKRSAKLPFTPLALICLMCVPVIINLGSIWLTPYRILLLLLFVPMFLSLLGGRSAKMRLFDQLMFLAFCWAAITILANHTMSEAIEPAGVLMVEGFGAYLVARVYIRNVGHFFGLAKVLFLLMLVFLPLALYETKTGDPIIITLLGKGVATLTALDELPRLGLERVQGVFEHSILFGMFCATSLGVIYHSYRGVRASMKAYAGSFVAMICVFLSLSSGSMLAVAVQGLFVGWDMMMKSAKKRWTILISIFTVLYVTLDMLSNRSPVNVVISTITFNLGSSFNRILIWEYGTVNVANNPIFGLGFNDWARPDWMGNSVDNFWLLLTMRHGLPFLLLFVGSIAILWRMAAMRAYKNPDHDWARFAYFSAIMAMSVGGLIVHYWNAAFVWFMFLLGAGAWLVDAETETARPRGKSS